MKYTQTFNEFLNEQEEALNEDLSLILIAVLQAAVVNGLLIGKMSFKLSSLRTMSRTGIIIIDATMV